MYRIEQRAKMLQVHMGVPFLDIANEIGLSKKQFNRVIRNPEIVDEETMEKLSVYFKLTPEEMYEPVSVMVEYGYLSDLANAITQSVSEYAESKDIEPLIERFEIIHSSLKDTLIAKQEDLKVKPAEVKHD